MNWSNLYASGVFRRDIRLLLSAYVLIGRFGFTVIGLGYISIESIYQTVLNAGGLVLGVRTVRFWYMGAIGKIKINGL